MNAPTMKISALARLPDAGDPDLLFLLFHGLGAAARDMAPLAQRLAAEYPQAAVLCIDAPEPFDGIPGGGAGFQWYSTRDETAETHVERVDAALPGFIAVVRQLQQRFHIGWERTLLAGFSQGAIMALEAVQAEPSLAGRVLAFAGRHASSPMHAPVDTAVHFLHGLDDTTIPPAAAIDAAQRFVAYGGDVTADVLPGVGHALDPALIDQAIQQLRSFLPKRVWREALAQAPITGRRASSDELH